MLSLSFPLPLSCVICTTGFSDVYNDQFFKQYCLWGTYDTVGISPRIFCVIMYWNGTLPLMGKGHHLIEQGLITQGNGSTIPSHSPGKLSFAVCLCGTVPISGTHFRCNHGQKIS